MRKTSRCVCDKARQHDQRSAAHTLREARCEQPRPLSAISARAGARGLCVRRAAAARQRLCALALWRTKGRCRQSAFRLLAAFRCTEAAPETRRDLAGEGSLAVASDLDG